jgi:(1->4)-alpha-D-glucan 1-alpha-D-glucosylmutase
VQEQGPAFDDLVGELDEAEAAIVLGRAVLKLTLAGIPDTYQGTERIARRLVDPDNRSAPDWNGELQTQLDRRKFGVTRKLLRLRRENPRLFTEGAYEPIAAPPHCFGFRRRHDDQSLEVTIALRSGTALPRLNGRQVIDEPFARVSLLSG